MIIQIRFIRSDSFIARAIHTITWGAGGDWSHVEFITPDGYLGSQAPDGVKLRPFDYCTFAEELKVSVNVPDDVGGKVIAFANEQLGKPYDYKSILGFIIKRDWTDDEAWFCSELVAAAFLNAGFPLLRTEECNQVSPSTLSLSPYLVQQV
jgi:uncharacterized protein YycO